MKTDELLAGHVIKFTVILFLLMVNLIRAWVTMKLWNWYVPQALGAPQLTVASAFGITLLVHCITDHRGKRDVTKSPWYSACDAIVSVVLFLLLGWIGTFFI